ncbi:MAG: hypothetical protein A2046_10945 [Bacteroidetes bacterium GWA2_30_7]|nr:MAG: hypothetical protein A2046_10945 [Bacteroidetes bacterium GWA2_30_7]
MDNNTWTAIGSFATCIYTVAFIISLALIYRQLRSMQISTMATAFSKALDILQNEDRRHDRRIIFSMQGVPLEKWNDEQRLAGERVIHSYDQVGTMIRAKMFNKELIVDSWGNSLRMAKPLLMPLVQEYRSKWKSEEIWDGFEWLCDEAEEFQRKLKLKKNFKTLMNTLAH